MLLGPGTQTIVDAGAVAILNQAIVAAATVGPLHNATVDLVVASIAPTPNTQFGDLTIPAWTGYAAQTVTWTAAQTTSPGVDEIDGDSVAFTLPSTAVGQTIYGWALSDTTPILVAVTMLSSPVVIQDPGTALLVPVLFF
jgi:hypothetical protein